MIMKESGKILSMPLLKSRLETLRASGKRIVFTNGCFDILHAGHVQYLIASKREGDLLVVGINSDRSVKTIKGGKRPIVPEDQRAFVLAGLECVDYITIFQEPDPLQVIRSIMPDVLVKGADWPETGIVGADLVKENGGRVVRIELMPDISTSKIIDKILDTFYNP